MADTAVETRATYTESLQVVDAEGVAKEVEDGILEHAAMAIAGPRDQQWQLRECNPGTTHDRTKRSRFSHLGFLGLNLMNLLKRTWAMGAMPL